MLNIKYSNQAKKFLKKSDRILTKRLLSKINELKKDPILHNTKAIKDDKEKLFIIRVGDYRILYEIDHESNILGIVKIDKRSKVYK